MKKTFELGMRWFRDWHDFEVTKIFKNGKIQITETWISEDSGKECKSAENYNVSEDEHGQFAWREKDKEYAFDENEEDGYHWWARTYACGAEYWNGLTEEEVIKELEEQGYEVKEQETTTNTTNKEETKMARFELNGTVYEANDKGNYFYKSTGLNDKNGNPIMKRVSRAVYEQAFEEYTQSAADDAEWMQGYGPELEEAWAEQEELKDKETEENFNKKSEKKQGAKKSRKSKDVAFRHQDITLTAKQVAFIKEAQQTSFYENGVESTLWVDVLVDEIGGEFAGKPMTVGAMISTLKEKELVYVAVEKVNNKKSKYFGFTELGQMVLEELG